MRVAVIAGTGGIGRWLLALAREDGDRVKTLVRDRRKLPADLGAIGVIEGDARDARAVAAVVSGCDVVLSALGAPSLANTDIREIGTRNIIEAMRLGDARRLAVVSAATAEDRPGSGLLARFLRPALAHTNADCLAMEKLVAATDFAWTIVRPTRLTDGPRSGLYRVEERFVPQNGTQISRADVADFMVRTIADERTIRKIATLAY